MAPTFGSHTCWPTTADMACGSYMCAPLLLTWQCGSHVWAPLLLTWPWWVPRVGSTTVDVACGSHTWARFCWRGRWVPKWAPLLWHGSVGPPLMTWLCGSHLLWRGCEGPTTLTWQLWAPRRWRGSVGQYFKNVLKFLKAKGIEPMTSHITKQVRNHSTNIAFVFNNA